MLPQETLRSLAKVVSSPENLCICLQNLRSLAKVLLHSPAKSIAFPKKLCIGLQNVCVLSQKNDETYFFPPPHIFKTFGSKRKSIALPQETPHLLAKVLHSHKKHCIARETSTFTHKSTTVPRETLQCLQNFCVLSQKFCSSNKICICSQIFCINLQKVLRFPRNFAFACKIFSLSSKTFAFARKVLKYSSWSYLLFPLQTFCERRQSV